MAKRGSRRTAAANQQRSQQSKRARVRSGWRLWLRRLVIWGGALALIGALFLGAAVVFAERSLPSYNSLAATQPGQTVVVRARDGSELIELGPSYGQWLNSDQIPQVMKDAMVSVEDRRFYSHFGVDPIGLVRAIYVWMTGDKRIQATSTITQQLARNLFLNSNRSFDRKVREAVLAMALEMKFSKQQILALYLNKVYFGGGAYGIDSASRKFFSHPATHLSVGEAAIIAGLVKAPSRFSPTADVDAAVKRANVVLALMREQGRISASEAAVNPATVKLKKDSNENSVRYFTDWVLPQLEVMVPDTTEPLEVWTTLDPGMQNAAAQAIKANAPKGAQGALVSLDRDGAILAMVGGTDYVTSNYNRATEAMRQPGSAWKLFVYIAALEAGYTPDDRVKDVPVTIDGWSPHNAGGSYAGEMSVRDAFAYSKNTVAAQLGNEVGFGTVASVARRFGITTPISTYPAMVLGSSEVRVIQLTQAFAEISDGGFAIQPYGIVKVTDTKGDVLFQHQPGRFGQLIPDYVAAGMTDMLQTTVATGTARAAQIGRPVAGKTGTTSLNKDGWFLGFSSGITTGVWMGRDDAKPVPGLHGGSAPAKAFADYMNYAVKDRPVEQFKTELKLPEWQQEPDDEHYYDGNPGDYYYTDEQGNLIQPNKPETPGQMAFPPGSEPGAQSAPSRNSPNPPSGDNGQAASDDFLDRAIGKGPGASPAPPPRTTLQQTGPRAVTVQPGG
ncbi:transglycosylase domain-containing protein [Tsuneonella mangrovi]|uniref:transglycosylase domain-containing protein n=1 Tax=Tsuneonella mangrovi TaxID=1982042 RepID=UPI000BA2A3B0|nr:PBP1A family penicillin-binding protein [Tsuneonella mangrovi]